MLEPLPPVDFTNLHRKQEEVSERYEGLNEFVSFYRGLLLGVLLSFPIQLLLKPMSLENGQIRYGSTVVLAGVDALWYAFVVGGVFFFILILVPVAYRWAKNLNNWEKVRLETNQDHDALFEKSKERLKTVCNDRGLRCIARDNLIVCENPRLAEGGLMGRWGENRETLLKLEFDPSVSVLHVGFSPENSHAQTLIREFERYIKDEYDKMYEEENKPE